MDLGWNWPFFDVFRRLKLGGLERGRLYNLKVRVGLSRRSGRPLSRSTVLAVNLSALKLKVLSLITWTYLGLGVDSCDVDLLEF